MCVVVVVVTISATEKKNNKIVTSIFKLCNLRHRFALCECMWRILNKLKLIKDYVSLFSFSENSFFFLIYIRSYMRSYLNKTTITAKGS